VPRRRLSNPSPRLNIVRMGRSGQPVGSLSRKPSEVTSWSVTAVTNQSIKPDSGQYHGALSITGNSKENLSLRFINVASSENMCSAARSRGVTASSPASLSLIVLVRIWTQWRNVQVEVKCSIIATFLEGMWALGRSR